MVRVISVLSVIRFLCSGLCFKLSNEVFAGLILGGVDGPEELWPLQDQKKLRWGQREVLIQT
jgi:hypothetical protein